MNEIYKKIEELKALLKEYEEKKPVSPTAYELKTFTDKAIILEELLFEEKTHATAQELFRKQLIELLKDVVFVCSKRIDVLKEKERNNKS